MAVKHQVKLTADERAELEAIVGKGRVAAARRRRAQILLKCDEGEGGPGWTDDQVAEAFDVHPATVGGVRRRLVERGLHGAIEQKPQENPRRETIFDGVAEAKLIALRYSPPPDGHAEWSLRLLADKAVELNIVASCSHETVRQVLKRGQRRRAKRAAS